MTTKKPVSNSKWFVIAVPADEAIEVAEGFEADNDVWLREIGQDAREYYNEYVKLFEEDF